MTPKIGDDKAVHYGQKQSESEIETQTDKPPSIPFIPSSECLEISPNNTFLVKSSVPHHEMVSQSEDQANNEQHTGLNAQFLSDREE